MKFFDSDAFKYKDNELHCEGLRLADIADQTGTPVYVYSKRYFVDRYWEFFNAFKGINYKIFFSAKSNFNLNVIKILSQCGSGVDINSAGELMRALKAGVNPQNIIQSGVGKTEEEILEGIRQGVKLIKAESFEEILLIDKIAGSINKKVETAFRVNPDVDSNTHPYISTGLLENKFGIESSDAVKFYQEASRLKNIILTGIDMHIGSLVSSASPYLEAVDKLSEIFMQLKAEGINLKHFDIGGGMGINYNDEDPLDIREFAELLIPKFKLLNCEIWFEPGRYLTANGGALVTKVLYSKQSGNKNFIIVDSGMNDLIRPSIYGAYHHIQPLVKNDSAKELTADIVGPVCESGDFLAKGRKINEVKTGDYLAIMSAGAYGMTMSSNYNARRRPPEVIVDKDKFYITRGRESFEHLLFDEKIIDDLHIR
jgi:diaminopimelate decarboxylase